MKRRVAQRSKLSKALSAVFVVMLSLLPIYALFGSFHVGAANADSRKVLKVQELNQRTRDAKSPRVFSEPIISVTFDDGWADAYNNSLPILQKYGIRTTQYVISGEFDNAKYISYNQAKSLYQAGHEIGSHTVTHPYLTNVSDEQLKQELKDSKATLGTIMPITDFASPFGAADNRTIEQITQYYRSNRLSDSDSTFNIDENLNVYGNFDNYTLNAFAVTKNTSLDEIQHYVDYTIRNNGWLILVYHQINEDVTDKYSISPSVFESQIKIVSRSQARVATISAVVSSLNNPLKGLEY